MSQSRISRHLGILKQTGLIKEERKGKWVIYKLSNERNILLSYIHKEMRDSPTYIADISKIKETLKKKKK